LVRCTDLGEMAILRTPSSSAPGSVRKGKAGERSSPLVIQILLIENRRHPGLELSTLDSVEKRKFDPRYQIRRETLVAPVPGVDI